MTLVSFNKIKLCFAAEIVNIPTLSPKSALNVAISWNQSVDSLRLNGVKLAIECNQLQQLSV